MKHIIFLFVFLWSLNVSAQIDVDRFTLTSDTTIASVDTVLWVFTTHEWTLNGNKVPTYQADLVTYRGGVRTVGLSSGLVINTQRSPIYRDYLVGQRDRLTNEIKTLQRAGAELAAQRAAIIAELISLQNR